MAFATVELVSALRATVARLEGDAEYQWGHMGLCNCGHLAQCITRLGKREIHAWALEREGDWEQHANDYCPASGLRIDDVISAMLDIGLTTEDIAHLEKLTGPEVLARLPAGRRHLRRNVREDVVRYLRAWVELLDEELAGRVARAAAAS
jgi:hypothetical protein